MHCPSSLRPIKWAPGLYVGKTADIEERDKEHANEDRLFYTTALVHSNPATISKLETGLIRELRNRNVKLINNTDASEGNPNADWLYVAFDDYLPDDQLCELTVEIDGFPIELK